MDDTSLLPNSTEDDNRMAYDTWEWVGERSYTLSNRTFLKRLANFVIPVPLGLALISYSYSMAQTGFGVLLARQLLERLQLSCDPAYAFVWGDLSGGLLPGYTLQSRLLSDLLATEKFKPRDAYMLKASSGLGQLWPMAVITTGYSVIAVCSSVDKKYYERAFSTSSILIFNHLFAVWLSALLQWVSSDQFLPLATQLSSQPAVIRFLKSIWRNPLSLLISEFKDASFGLDYNVLSALALGRCDSSSSPQALTSPLQNSSDFNLQDDQPVTANCNSLLSANSFAAGLGWSDPVTGSALLLSGVLLTKFFLKSTLSFFRYSCEGGPARTILGLLDCNYFIPLTLGLGWSLLMQQRFIPELMVIMFCVNNLLLITSDFSKNLNNASIILFGVMLGQSFCQLQATAVLEDVNDTMMPMAFTQTMLSSFALLFNVKSCCKKIRCSQTVTQRLTNMVYSMPKNALSIALSYLCTLGFPILIALATAVLSVADDCENGTPVPHNGTNNTNFSFLIR